MLDGERCIELALSRQDPGYARIIGDQVGAQRGRLLRGGALGRSTNSRSAPIVFERAGQVSYCLQNCTNSPIPSGSSITFGRVVRLRGNALGKGCSLTQTGQCAVGVPLFLQGPTQKVVGAEQFPLAQRV